MASDAERFIQSLLDPATQVQFTLSGEHQVAPDWHVPPRTLPIHLIYYVTNRAIVGRVEDRPIRAEAGSLLWVPAMTPHAFWIEPGSLPFSTRYFRVSLSRGEAPIEPPGGAVLVDDAWEAGQTAQQIVDELPAKLPMADARLRALLVLLFTSVLRLRDRQGAGQASLSRAQRLKLLRLARDQAKARLTPADLAAAVDLSPDYFTRVFRKSFGQSPRAWLVAQRIQHAAAAMVNSTRSISQIATDFGYDDIFLFSRQFKQVMGVGPMAYRQTH